MKGEVVRPASVRYMGFQSTSEGREYTLRVDGQGERIGISSAVSLNLCLGRGVCECS